MFTDAEWQKGDGFIVWKEGGRRLVSAPVAVLDVSDEAALIEVVAVAITDDQYPREVWAALDNELRDSYRDSARAALTALGVLPKRRKS